MTVGVQVKPMITDFYFSEDADTFKNTGFSFRLGFVPVCFYNKRKWEKCFEYKDFFFFFPSNALLKTRGLIMILHIRSDLKICSLNLCMRSDLQRMYFTLVSSETHSV